MSAAVAELLSALTASSAAANSGFRELVDTLPAGVYTTDVEGRLTYFNAAAARMFGCTPTLGVDKWFSAWKVLLPDGTPFSHEHRPMALALEGQEPRTGLELIVERPDGTQVWCTLSAAALRDAAGRIIGAINIVSEISDRKPAERTARLLSAIVDSSDDAIVSKDLNGVVMSWNKSAERLFGYAAQEAIGKTIAELIIPEDRQDEEPEILARLRRGERVDHLETVRRRKDGSLLEVSLTISPVRDAQRRIIGASKIARDISDRRRADRTALLLSAIVDSSDDAIISKDLNGVVMSWNRSAERLFGYTAEEAIGKTIAELIIPDDRQDEGPDILARLRRGERVDHFETVRRRKDGSLLDISLTISPVKDAQGRIIGASKIARDISDRKRADRAIEALNAQLTSDLAAMTRIQQLSTRPSQTDGLTDLLPEIVDAAVEITGADMGNIQLLEDGVLNIAAHRGFDARFVNFMNHINKGETACGTALERGERIIVEDIATSPVFAGKPALGIMWGAGVRAVQSTPLVTRGGQILGMLSTHYRTPRRPSERDLRLIDILARQTADLIERKRAETALLASERRFRQLADAMPALVWTARPDGYVDYYNERWYEFTGFSRDRFGNESWEPVLHPDDLQKTHEAWSAAIKSGMPYDIEYRLWDGKENRWRWFVGRALPVRDARGQVVKWFGSCTDIDEQKSVQAELERVNEDLEQFAFSASHDLQEPLRTIKIYSDLLARRLGEQLDPDAREYLRFLRTGASRMEELVRDLLAYTRATTFEPSATMADANEALQAALHDLEHAIAETGARISADPLPPVRVHYTHLHQIFQNLIGNALKYRSPERRPEVFIGAERQDGQCVFAVRDNGIGIEPEYKESIFGLFKRLHTNDEYSGTGIGLAICQRIVGRYQGRIWVESQPGQGSIFRFTLPV